MKSVLAAIDFSPVADSVVRRGIEFARAFKARLVLLHVIQPPTFFVGDQLVDDTKATGAAEAAADRRLARLTLRLRQKYQFIEAKRVTGLPVNIILEEAAKVAAECIVLGSHGHGAVYDLLVGSTAGGILKKAKCPVLIVPVAERRSARAATHK